MKAKEQYPEEFTPNTVTLIHRKRKLWKFIQKSGRRITRLLRATHRTLCIVVKRSIKLDRNALLENEAVELSNAFKVCRFKGYSLLKKQHRTRSKAVMPPEPDFTTHYRTHYQPGTETPLEVHGCALPPSLMMFCLAMISTLVYVVSMTIANLVTMIALPITLNEVGRYLCDGCTY